MAESPLEFKRCDKIESILDPVWGLQGFTITNRGVRLDSRIGPGEIDGVKDYILNLHCVDARYPVGNGRQAEVVFIRLVRTPQCYVRHHAGIHLHMPIATVGPSDAGFAYVAKMLTAQESSTLEHRLSKNFHVDIVNLTGNESFSIRIADRRPKALWEGRLQAFITDGTEDFMGILQLDFEGTFPQADSAPRDECTEEYYSWSSVFVICGFSRRLMNRIRGEASPVGDLPPWVLCFGGDSEDGKKVSNLVSRQPTYGASYTMDGVRELVEPKLASLPALSSADAVCKKVEKEFSLAALGFQTVRTREPFQQFRVNLSCRVVTEQHQNTERYRVIITAGKGGTFISGTGLPTPP